MYIATSANQKSKIKNQKSRKGIVLLIVLTLLTLFAVVVVGFVFYSKGEVASNKSYKESQIRERPDPDVLLAHFLNQFIFGTTDANSALRANDLMRNMYGGPNGNAVAFNGTGKLHRNYQGTGTPGGDGPDPILTSISIPGLDIPTAVYLDPYYLMNYGWVDRFNADATKQQRNPNDHPEWGSFNPPYTYPDHNAPYLAALRSDGVLIARSFVRTGPPMPSQGVVFTGYPNGFDPFDPANYGFWTYVTDFAVDSSLPVAAQLAVGYHPPNNPPNNNLTKAHRRAMTLRPLPVDGYIDQTAIDTSSTPPKVSIAGCQFPPPEDLGGDVKNLPPGTKVLLPDGTLWAGNDAYWMNLNFPILTAPDGRRYQPLFAPTAIDLDGKINVNTAFNDMGLTGSNPIHVSSIHGIGPWEIAPPIGPEKEFDWFSKIGTATAAEYLNVLRGRVIDPTTGASVDRPLSGRYQDAFGAYYASPSATTAPKPGLPGATVPSSINYSGRFYSLTDLDGKDATGARSGLPVAPTAGTATGWSSFLSFAATTYENGTGVGTNYPSLFDPLFPSMADRRFRPSDLEALYRMGDTGTDALTSDLLRLCPFGFGTRGLSNRLRRMVTTDSTDRAIYGRTPWYRTAVLVGTNKLALAAGGVYPFGPALAMPPTAAELAAGTSEFGSNFQGIALQTANILLRRYDRLNDPFTAYPTIDATGRFSGPALPATTDRTTRASEIFLLLIQATGAPDPTTYTVAPVLASDDMRALRWLAQLAANIVDYMDPDDVSTVFFWGDLGSTVFKAAYGPSGLTPQFVFGTELPRVVLNEAYVKYDATVAATTISLTGDAWVELYNPLSTDTSLANSGAAQLQFPGGTANAVYQIVIAPKNPTARAADNVDGAPLTPFSTLGAMAGEYSSAPTQTISPSTGNYKGTTNAYPESSGDYPAGPSMGYYVVGPTSNLPGSGGPKATLKSSKMSFVMPPMATAGFTLPKPTILLRRLACPYLDPQPLPALPDFNPYITVDYLEDVEPNVIPTLPITLPGLTTVTASTSASYGRVQAYAAHKSQNQKQTPDTVAATPTIEPRVGQPQTTFFRQNAIEEEGSPPPSATRTGQTLRLPFDYLNHLDRPLVNPMELLNVSGFKPHEFTQQFQQFSIDFQATSATVVTVTVAPVTTAMTITGTSLPTIAEGHVFVIEPGTASEETVIASGPVTYVAATMVLPATATFTATFTKSHGVPPATTPYAVAGRQFNHTAPWHDFNTRLYRFLEGVSCLPLSQWGNPQFRQAGKININTIWDQEVLLALADMPLGVSLAATSTAVIGSGAITGTDPVTGESEITITPGVAATYGIRTGDVFWVVDSGTPTNQEGIVISSVTSAVKFRTRFKNTYSNPILVFRTLQSEVKRTYDLLAFSRDGRRSPSTVVNLPNNPPNNSIGAAPLTGNQESRPFWSLTVGAQPTTSSQMANRRADGVTYRDTIGVEQTILRNRELFDNAATASDLPRRVRYKLDNGKQLKVFELLNPEPPTGSTAPTVTNIDTVGLSGVDTTTAPTTHPFSNPFERRNLLLSRISNNITTRSNTFGLWLTVGYFEVKRQPLNPVLPESATNPMVDKLAGELGRADGQHKRHRFFAVLDRSALDVFLSPTGTVSMDPRKQENYSFVTTTSTALAPGATVVTPALMNAIIPGTVVTLNNGTATETRVVNAITGTSFSVSALSNTYAAGNVITGTTVVRPTVLHWSIIE